MSSSAGSTPAENQNPNKYAVVFRFLCPLPHNNDLLSVDQRNNKLHIAPPSEGPEILCQEILLTANTPYIYALDKSFLQELFCVWLNHFASDHYWSLDDVQRELLRSAVLNCPKATTRNFVHSWVFRKLFLNLMTMPTAIVVCHKPPQPTTNGGSTENQYEWFKNLQDPTFVPVLRTLGIKYIDKMEEYFGTKVGLEALEGLIERVNCLVS